MLRNPIHLRLERLQTWHHLTFMVSLCERMYPNYQIFCQKTKFGDPVIYRRILDLVWHVLLMKNIKINFDTQLEKLENYIPSSEGYDLYAVYPAIDACIALGELIHSLLSGQTLEFCIAISQTSIRTVAMLEMTKMGREMTRDELKVLPAIVAEWDVQWEIFRLLAGCGNHDLNLIKGLRYDLREAAISNIGVYLAT
ncbi:Uncharacterized protein YjaG [Serratia symbiotica]|nr:Uncharacterized protein YjaG [Serratia symbiotica]